MVWTSGFSPSFLDAAAACALTNASAVTDATLLDYFETRLGYVNYPAYSRLSKRLAAANPLGPRVVTVAKETSQALSQIHFVYMDVGCWAGNGGKDEWPRHREFGVVHGDLALLCAFVSDKSGCPHYGEPPAWKKEGQLAPSPLVDAAVNRHPDWPRIRMLLDRLAGCIPDTNLRVLGATLLASPYIPGPPRGEDAPITVFLGDLHAPVANAPENAHIVENGREMLRGRLEVAADGLAGLSPASRAAMHTAEVGREFEWERTSTRESVESWLRLYHVKKQRTADIFQEAGPDLRLFVNALQKFHEKAWPLELVQLGDFFDLWIGFRRAFGGTLDKTDALDNLHPDALEFARFWARRTLFETDQGPHLVHLLTLGQRAARNPQTGMRLRTTFLHGNHDNYLKHGSDSPIIVPAGREHAGRKLQVTHLRSSWYKPGLWAEHGHQADAFNRDRDPRWGYKLTQLAFFEPGARSLEGPAGWFGSKATGKSLQRVNSIHHAFRGCLMDHWFSPAQPCRGIYVMGHSHEPMLKRVDLLPCPPREHRQGGVSGGGGA
ncbi:MAG: hypothetical protein JXP73_22170 [Deltaproteobacteria bacterium]|nr:hypothetical protein [Deltaproteobacteria bacterium]